MPGTPNSGPITATRDLASWLARRITQAGKPSGVVPHGMVTLGCNGKDKINMLSDHDCTGGLDGDLALINNVNGIMTVLSKTKTNGVISDSITITIPTPPYVFTDPATDIT